MFAHVIFPVLLFLWPTKVARHQKGSNQWRGSGEEEQWEGGNRILIANKCVCQAGVALIFACHNLYVFVRVFIASFYMPQHILAAR